mmetsp:Transcript_28776/g.46565  ORF Transcript_28776/g.46565 Transcript_28776/m.46565 type:complete len:158 (+) Transcript_28776:51-524(+)
MESRVSELERVVVGAAESTRGSVAGEIEQEGLQLRIAGLIAKLNEIEATRPTLASSKLRQSIEKIETKTALDNLGLLTASAKHVKVLDEEFEEFVKLNQKAPIDQKELPIQDLCDRESKLATLTAERKQVHDEIVELLQVYGAWVDSVSQVMVELEG